MPSRSLFIAVCIFLAGPLSAQQLRHPPTRPNILWLVADDMNWDSPGCFGGVAEGVTPNIDSLAEEGLQFWQAYVNIAICTPSRSVMWRPFFARSRRPLSRA